MPTLVETPRAWRPTREQWGLIGVLFVGVVLRAVSITGLGHTGDLFALMGWAHAIAVTGPADYYASGGLSNYPVLLYLLWPLGQLFAGENLRLAIRALSIPFDVGIGVLLFWLVRDLRLGSGVERVERVEHAERAGIAAAAFYLLNPAVIISGPLWGQVDGIGALPMLAALVAISRQRIAVAAVLATVAGLVKPQFGIAAFVLVAVRVLELRRSPDVLTAVQGIALAGLAAIATFAVVMLPLGLGPTSYLHILSITTDRYPYASLFGFNPWAIAYGFGEKDGGAFQVGLGITAIAIVLSLALLWRRRDLVGLLGVGALIGLELYFLPTRVHERYLFGAVVLLAPLAALVPRLRAPFVVLSGLFLVTLVYVLGNTPQQAVPIPEFARGDLLPWEITAISLPLTLVGVWCAWEVLRLYRPDATPAEPLSGNVM
jgi:dolichyl-phosphate-mannose-protein mannosyltransferase